MNSAASSSGAGGSPLLPSWIVEHPRAKAALPVLGNMAYFSLASGFLCTDVLALRVLLCFGYSGLVGFHLLHARPLRIPLAWSGFFVAVNDDFTVDRQQVSESGNNIFIQNEDGEPHFAERISKLIERFRNEIIV